jgi:hypothetical protein
MATASSGLVPEWCFKCLGLLLVQGRNAYEIHMPPEGSRGDRILRGESSESKIERAKASPCFYKESSLPDPPKAEGAKPKFAAKPPDPPVPEAERSRVKAKLHALLASLGLNRRPDAPNQPARTVLRSAREHSMKAPDERASFGATPIAPPPT